MDFPSAQTILLMKVFLLHKIFMQYVQFVNATSSIAYTKCRAFYITPFYTKLYNA